jgi:hypothetical protein
MVSADSVIEWRAIGIVQNVRHQSLEQEAQDAVAC